MTASVPLALSGNLGERHRCFNALVHEAYQKNMSLSVQDGKEPALDRLFKIDLASKQRNVDFIIRTLKDDDLLYVNRALKSRWLLEPQYSNIINPIFLEHELFPHMTLPAMNRMRHCIQMYLREPQRCNEFYQYYKGRNFDVAAKFLWHCSNEYVLNEVRNVMEKITPKLLKRMSEKVPQITKIYYESLKDNQTLLKYYLENDSEFFANVKYLLKTDSDVFFYMLENFFNPEKYCEKFSFNDAITNYIMKNHKNRFLVKPELYTAWFLNMKTLARHLSSEEIKELVLKLARAEYLQSWFSYQTVEPLIKRLSNDERVTFKNFIFVDKAFGSVVKDWPYPIPTPPTIYTPQKNLFEDTIKYPCSLYADSDVDFRCLLKKRKYCQWGGSSKTLLDQLFDKYRFYNFKKTLLMLRKQLRAESSPQNRQFMLLVLISKTGGNTEDVVSLLDLLSQYKNEPSHIRAAVLRSLVKRAYVWRLPPEHWTTLLDWGHGLGLDGSPSEANCNEGLHAVVIRDLLADVKPNEAVWETFLTNCFDNLHGYSLTVAERNLVCTRLPALLLATAQCNPNKSQLSILKHLLDTLEAYHKRFNDLPGVVEVVAAAVKNDCNATCAADKDIMLRRLYEAGVARKLLIRDYFEIMQTDASFVNALRHDISILENTEKFVNIIHSIQRKTFDHEMFFRKLALYFTEKEGLGERYRAVLEAQAATAPDKTLARSLARLSGSTFPSVLQGFDATDPRTPHRQIAAALRTHAHLVRPAFDLETFGWREAGAKAVANRVATCRQRDVERYYLECSTWRRTLRLALVLAKRVNKERDAFQVLASQRPGVALQAALRYFRRERDHSDPRIWEMVKSHIPKVDKRQLRVCINFTELVPAVMKAEYCFLVYMACKQNLPSMEWNTLSEIPYILCELDEKYIFDAIDAFLQAYFTDCVKLEETIHKSAGLITLYIEIAAKFLVLNTSEEMLEDRYKKIALPFLNRFQLFWKQVSLDEPVERFLDSFLFYLRYNKVYFDVKYVSCLPVFEKITEWMHGFLPMEKWFYKYVTVHLSMIYFKAVRHCLTQESALFSEPTKLEAAYMLGTTLGKFLVNEIEDLTRRYFPTIIELYGSTLEEYFSVYYGDSDESIKKFEMGVLYGLLASKSVPAGVLAKSIFMKFQNRMDRECVVDILNKFKESEIDQLRFDIDND